MRNRLIKIAAGAAWVAGTGVIAYPLIFRRPCLTWGATAEEVESKLPGDELLPEPDIVSTRAVTIDAPPSAISRRVTMPISRSQAFLRYLVRVSGGRPCCKDVCHAARKDARQVLYQR